MFEFRKSSNKRRVPNKRRVSNKRRGSEASNNCWALETTLLLEHQPYTGYVIVT